jgi:hypothetical protein
MARPPDDPDDWDEDEERPRRRPARGESDEPIAAIIPYKNAKALIAYYLGVFGLIPCVGSLLGPAALVLGILGLRYVQAHPTAKGTGHAITGIVLGSIEILIYVVLPLGFLLLGALGVFG